LSVVVELEGACLYLGGCSFVIGEVLLCYEKVVIGWDFPLENLWLSAVLRIRDPGSGAILTPGYGMDKKSGSGSGGNNPDPQHW
jgi:hypothetical protein